MDELGSFDDGDPYTTNLYVGNLAPDVDEEVPPSLISVFSLQVGMSTRCLSGDPQAHALLTHDPDPCHGWSVR